MALRPCTEQQLRGLDLDVLLITPSVSARDQEPRFRCPVNGCQYLGATLTHPGDCLRHLLDPKVGDVSTHQRLLASSFVSFRTAEGKPLVNSKPNVAAAVLYSDGVNDGKAQYAYMKVGGICSSCNQLAVQTCSCCPRSFCPQHQIQEAHGSIAIGNCNMFVCDSCQLNPPRIAASNMHHHILTHFEMIAQDLYTASGEWVSKYRLAKEGPVVSARAFSTQCFLEDIAAYRTKGSSACTRWIQAGKRPGGMYWLRAGTVFESKALVAFCCSSQHMMR